MYDIAIIGAGPAGATLARLVGPRYRVLLLEKNPGDGPGKCCGGLLAPDAQRMLSTLGLGLPKSVLQDPQLFVVRAIDIPHRLERFYQRHYINMDRRQFDRWLPLRRNIFLKGLKSRVVFHPGLRRLVMKLGIQSMDIYGRSEK